MIREAIAMINMFKRVKRVIFVPLNHVSRGLRKRKNTPDMA
jgi:hypothetical protein